MGRFEAGEPTTANFYNDKDGSTYWQVGRSDGDYSKTYRSKDETKDENSKNLLPVSKKNTPSWNYISQTKSKTVSENMYGESKTIKSYLIDGTAWDTTIQWISNSTGRSLTVGCKDWGNYYDSAYTLKRTICKT